MGAADSSYPHLVQTVLDCTDPRLLSEFYRRLLGLTYRPGDEPPEPGAEGGSPDWLVLLGPSGQRCLAFQQVDNLPETTWPEPGVAQQMHLDISVANSRELDAQTERAIALGARMVLDRTADPDEPLRVFADLAGHRFCLYVSAGEVDSDQ